MCKLFKTPTSITNWNVLSYEQVVAIFRAAGITCEIPVRDDYFWFPDESAQISILQEAHVSAPAYESITATQPGFDCDKFAHHACDVAYLKKVNGWFEVWGETPTGNHAWNVILSPSLEKGRVIITAFEAEPQKAYIWEIGTNPEYRIKTVYHIGDRV